MIEKILNILISKIAHDLNNYANTIGLLLEVGELKDLASVVDNLALYANVLKILKTDNGLSQQYLINYIKAKGVNVEFEYYNESLNVLIFALIEKCTKNALIIVKKNCIICKNFEINPEILSNLESNFSFVDEFNIFFYLFYVNFKNEKKIVSEVEKNSVTIYFH